METYDAKLAKSQEVAVVHVSYDKKDSEAKKWAKEAKMNWPLVLGSDRKASGMAKFSESDYIPEYRLVDAQGRAVPLPEGMTAVEQAVALAEKAAAGE